MVGRGRPKSNFSGYVIDHYSLTCTSIPDLYKPIVRIADMLNLDIIHDIARVGRGRFGFIATATTPSLPEVEEVQAETMAKKGAEASSKRPTEGALTDHLKVELEEVSHRQESLELDLDNSHLFLADSQEQLKDV
ncbi:hypothetical protein B296_00051083 [Ensete ventricosum]|uniref:Uncharacterized protein n=1 Tax=Ensete ventricosum TaxID=4639 RepID=A0A426YID0_ENSVE|nr:hypothetical protein B296_00051083 [Ensete ventricosum]